jgi:hypothetical protein
MSTEKVVYGVILYCKEPAGFDVYIGTCCGSKKIFQKNRCSKGVKNIHKRTQ